MTFDTYVWPDIRKKLEGLEDWQDRGLNDLLKEAQNVYVRRDEEKEKAKAKLMAAAIAEGNHWAKTHSYREVRPQSGHSKQGWEEIKGNRAPLERGPTREEGEFTNQGPICHFCKKIGH